MNLFSGFEVLKATRVFDTHLANIEPNVRDALRKALFDRTDKAVTAVCEYGYLDVDYSSSFFLQQGRSFTPLSRRTKRIHMFSSKFNKNDFEEGSEKIANSLRQSYLGYIVERPVRPPTIGRTFIKPPEVVDGVKAFFPTKTMIQADLCGIPLEFPACPYISQDQMVMACATASIWESSVSLGTKVGLPPMTTAEITASALSLQRTLGPATGSRGLRVDEEEKAFLSMGYDMQTWQYPSRHHLVEACYAHIEGGIPPVLNVNFPRQKVGDSYIDGLHAMTLVGHLMDTSRLHYDHRIFKDIYSAYEFVPAFLVNDDQNGIYLRAEVCEPPRKVISKTPYRSELHIATPLGNIYGYCYALLVPFPPRVLLPGTYATRFATYWLQWLVSRGLVKKTRLVLRTYLIRSNKFKQGRLRHCHTASSSAPLIQSQMQLANVYRSLMLPRYVWVVEYGYLKDWLGHDSDKLKIQGELLFDATISPAVQPDWLCLHVQGGILIRRIKREGMEAKYIPLPNDQPYLCNSKIDIRP